MSARSPRFPRVAASVVVLAFASVVPVVSASPAFATSRYQTRTVKLAHGIVWRSITDSRGPNEIQALIVTPYRRLRLTLGAAGPVMPSLKKTSALARRVKALAGINGDFRTDDGRSLHPVVQAGMFVNTGVQTGSLFGVTRNRKTAFLGRPDIDISVTDGTIHGPRNIAAWNGGQPVLKQMVAFTDAGGTVEIPPTTACSARLVLTSGPTWTLDKTAKLASYTVDTAGCGTALLPSGGVVLSALPGTNRGTWLQSLSPGQTVTISEGSIGWPGMSDAIGGMPMLLQNGVVVAPTTCIPADFCAPNPRTAVGVTSGCVDHLSACHYIIVVVDGRRAGSVGMTFQELAALMQHLGATWALNLDGGGSSAVWIKGHGIVNKPSDGAERSVPNALLVVPH